MILRLHLGLVYFPAVIAVVRVVWQRAGKGEELPAFLTCPFDLSRFPRPLLFLLLPDKLLLAVFTEVWDMIPGWIIGESFSTTLTGLFQPNRFL